MLTPCVRVYAVLTAYAHLVQPTDDKPWPALTPPCRGKRHGNTLWCRQEEFFSSRCRGSPGSHEVSCGRLSLLCCVVESAPTAPTALVAGSSHLVRIRKVLFIREGWRSFTARSNNLLQITASPLMDVMSQCWILMSFAAKFQIMRC